MDKRRNRRIGVANLVVDVSDGNGFFLGYVSDISSRGAQLNDIPKKINDHVDVLTLVISGNGKNFKMKAMPRWASEEGFTKKMGVELIDISYKWIEFISELEARPADVWGYSN